MHSVCSVARLAHTHAPVPVLQCFSALVLFFGRRRLGWRSALVQRCVAHIRWIGPDALWVVAGCLAVLALAPVLFVSLLHFEGYLPLRTHDCWLSRFDFVQRCVSPIDRCDRAALLDVAHFVGLLAGACTVLSVSSLCAAPSCLRRSFCSRLFVSLQVPARPPHACVAAGWGGGVNRAGELQRTAPWTTINSSGSSNGRWSQTRWAWQQRQHRQQRQQPWCR